MKKIKQRQSRLVIKRIKAKSGADAVAKKFGEDKEFRTRVVPNKKKDYKIPFDGDSLDREGVRLVLEEMFNYKEQVNA